MFCIYSPANTACSPQQSIQRMHYRPWKEWTQTGNSRRCTCFLTLSTKCSWQPDSRCMWCHWPASTLARQCKRSTFGRSHWSTTLRDSSRRMCCCSEWRRKRSSLSWRTGSSWQVSRSSSDIWSRTEYIRCCCCSLRRLGDIGSRRWRWTRTWLRCSRSTTWTKIQSKKSRKSGNIWRVRLAIWFPRLKMCSLLLRFWQYRNLSDFLKMWFKLWSNVIFKYYCIHFKWR